ncbi:uncharacterized protein MELLADRAFT_74577 [Melampsora larici-populina 98AG31]|uniref:Cytochrome c oxidase subunit 4, mitochondrial n=1 Tax=Melampsora larici-populina (strain 98AG31 / pathotype 3-4-7) TaxID=747676 RepID=F4RHB8_MELLP|nr:uncharacterized protein MELLADRAFT_74577 [Melampsora larici-populina 98AG31]EGG08240.1 hypothetical protein MELLADRAFT_74577 [Melampsora larici-populina 98AG31]
MSFSKLISRQSTRLLTKSITSSKPTQLGARSRLFTSSSIQSGADHHDDHHDARPPIIQGVGAKPGTVPTDLEQATGIERYEILARMEGLEPFDNKPLAVPHMGTLADPVKVFSLERTRIVGCTGFPVDSHDTIYMKVSDSRPRRCGECGCAYVIDYHGEPDAPKPKLSVLHEHPGEKPRLKWGWGDMTTHTGGNQR